METAATLYRFGPFTLDPFRRMVARDAEPIALTPKAVDVLAALVEQAGNLVSKTELMERVWPATFVEEANLSVQISALRRVLGHQPDGRDYVETLPRRGYRFVAPVERRAAQASRSLAVLPWRALNLDPGEEFLGVGMADALITRVGALGQLLVRPTAAVLRYAGRERDLPTVARELSVDVVLDGSLQRVGTRLRATAQLVRASDGATLWAGQFEPDATDLLAVQDAIAEPVMRALLLHVDRDSTARLSRTVTLNPQAYQAFLRGRYFWNKLTAPWLLKAREAFSEASALDPGYAPSQVGLADTHIVLGLLGELPPREAWMRASEAARRALECDPDAAEAHVALAYAQLFEAWDWGAAERQLRLAVELDPRSAATHLWFALFLGMRGQLREALAEVMAARAIDPLSLTVNTALGFQFYLSARSDDQIEQHRRTLELEPDFAIGHWALGLAYAHRRQYVAAISAQRRACELTQGNLLMQTVLARYLAMAGEVASAREMLAALEAARTSASVSTYRLAAIYSALGEQERAFEYLDQACEERDHWLVWLKVDPLVADLRSHPRYSELLRRVGLD